MDVAHGGITTPDGAKRRWTRKHTIIAVVAVAAIGFAGHMIAHHVGGFYARIEEEDERARREEEKEEQAAHAAAQEEEKRNEEKGRTQ